MDKGLSKANILHTRYFVGLSEKLCVCVYVCGGTRAVALSHAGALFTISTPFIIFFFFYDSIFQ